MALMTGFGLFIVSVLIAALSRTVAEEIEAWSPSIIRGLISLAVGRLPESQRERFCEEWHSHVNEVPGKIGKLFVAAGFLVAAYNIQLIDRMQVLERLSQMLVQCDEAYSTVALVVVRLQNDETLPLPLREEMVNLISLRLNVCRERNHALATVIAATPHTFVAKVSFTLGRVATRRNCEELSLQTAQIKDQVAQLVRLIDERKQGNRLA
jgi:hypothetical protein